MLREENYIRAVLVVFWLLILSRIPAFINGTMDAMTIVSTVVELGFFMWGVVILWTSAPRAHQS
ncbi:hypothetical protein ABWH93_14085 [Seohaeicola saemankumensis]|uniref:hypothetical protein n=1 Tax=Seohaeicola TaxID=481178 RepID=UPI0035D05B3A